MARTELQELMYQYMRKGMRDWYGSEVREGQSDIEKLLGAEILREDDYLMSRAVDPEKHRGRETLVPMPKLTTAQIVWAFFTPRQEAVGKGAEWTFDLVLLLPCNEHICFRLEPADRREDGRHGYGHMQLSWRFHGKRAIPKEPLKWLPDSYPAIPVPGTDSLDRFLMLVVALHGFPSGGEALLTELLRNQPTKIRVFLHRIRTLLHLVEH